MAARSRAPLVIATAAAVLYAATFSTMGILQYLAGNVSYTDTATFEEMLWRTLHGQFLRSSQLPHCLLGSHVQLIHLLLLPVYAVFPSLITLMVCETVALASGTFAVYALARHVLKNDWLGAVFAIAYVLYTPLQMINLEGGGAYNTFRPITFAVPLLLWAFYFVVRGRLVAFSVFAFLTLLCKQEFGLILFMVGLYVAVVLRRRAFGLAWSAVGLVWFLVAMGVVIPYFRHGPSHVVSYYAHLGSSPGEIARNVLLHPLRALAIAFAPEKLEFFLIMFLPVGFLCLLSPASLAMALPGFAVCLLSERYATYTPWFHYHTPIIPFVFIAAIHGTRNLGLLAARYGEAARRRLLIAAGVLVLACAVGTNMVYSKSPLSFRFYDPKSASYYGRLYVITDHAREARGLAKSIPRDKRVSASLFINTYFTHHAAAYTFPQGLEPGHPAPPDYVVLDLEERWLFDSPEQRKALERLQKGDDYERVNAPQGFLVFKRREKETAIGD